MLKIAGMVMYSMVYLNTNVILVRDNIIQIIMQTLNPYPSLNDITKESTLFI